MINKETKYERPEMSNYDQTVVKQRKEEQATESHSSQTEKLRCENFHSSTVDRW